MISPATYWLAVGTINGDPDPIFDDCGSPDWAGFAPNGAGDNHNVGDLLNAKGVTWGWFQGGFAPTATVGGVAQCNATTTGHPGILGNPNDPIHAPIQAYVAHHNPFMYYKHMANSHHLPPISNANVGRTDQAQHQYDLSLFFDALDHGRLQAVSLLKAPRALDGHPGSTNSDPLSEQLFLVETINKLQQSSEWKETVVIIAYDDSDGWYDHVTDCQPLECSRRRRARRRKLRYAGGRRLSRPLRLRCAPALPCDLPLGKTQFR
jgi:phospholipase C